MVKRSRAIVVLMGFMVVLMLACQPTTQQTETEEAGGTEAGGKGAAGKKTAAHRAKEAEREAKVTVPAGTELSIRLVDAINTGKTSEGASFEGTLAAALVAGGVEVAPVGSRVTGTVTHVVSSGRLNRPAELSLTLTSLAPTGGAEVGISTNAWTDKGQSHKKRDIEMIGGGAAAGAIIGALTGGKKGAAIGGAAGAGAGTGVAALTGKKEIILASETKLDFSLSAPITFTVKKK